MDSVSFSAWPSGSPIAHVSWNGVGASNQGHSAPLVQDGSSGVVPAVPDASADGLVSMTESGVFVVTAWVQVQEVKVNFTNANTDLSAPIVAFGVMLDNYSGVVYAMQAQALTGPVAGGLVFIGEAGSSGVRLEATRVLSLAEGDHLQVQLLTIYGINLWMMDLDLYEFGIGLEIAKLDLAAPTPDLPVGSVAAGDQKSRISRLSRLRR